MALARGIVRISTTKIIGAVRAITVEVGRDPKDFALLSFGGGGGLVAVDIARELSIPTVIVPPGQGAFSAFGMLMADVQHDFSRTAVTPLAELDDMVLEAGLRRHGGGGAAGARRPRASRWPTRCCRAASTCAMPARSTLSRCRSRRSTDRGWGPIEKEFAELHERQYGHTMDRPRRGHHGPAARDRRWSTSPHCRRCLAGSPGEVPRTVTRPVYLSETEPAVPYALYTSEELLAGDEIAGPAVIAEHTATTVIHANDTLRVGDYGEMLVIAVAAA